MEQWKISVLIGVALIILAIVFAIVRREISIWIFLIIMLAIVDIASGLLRKNR